MKINFIKMLLDLEEDNSKDELISLLIAKCEEWLKYITGIEDTASCSAFEEAVIDLVVANYNKMGSEGLSSERIGSLNLEYDEIPFSVRAIISSIKRVKF